MNARVDSMNQQVDLLTQRKETSQQRQSRAIQQIQTAVDPELPFRTEERSTPTEITSMPSGDIESAPLDDAPPPAGNISAGIAQNADQMFQQGYDKFQGGDYANAAVDFARTYFLTDQNELKAVALYWVGDSFYHEQDWEKSLQSFARLEVEFPNSPIMANGLLKRGFIYYKTGDDEKGKTALESVVERYPDSEAAKLARARLMGILME